MENVKVENQKQKRFLEMANPHERKNPNRIKIVKNATRKIMYCKNKKKIFVLFHVQNEKFREKNTKMFFNHLPFWEISFRIDTYSQENVITT